jgi:hypothetical protein
MCIGLSIIILISKSETRIPISSILNPVTNEDTKNNLVQKPELTDKPERKEDRTVVDVGYTTA